MSDSKKPKVLATLDAIMLISEVGFAVAIPIVLGVVIGNFLDEYVGGRGLVLTLFILAGIVAGIFSAYRALMKVMGNKS